MYFLLLFYLFLFPFHLFDFLSLNQLSIYFCKSALIFFSICLRSVHSMLDLRLAWWCFINVWVNFVNDMLGLRLAWVHKVYYKTKVFSKKVTFSNKWSLNSFLLSPTLWSGIFSFCFLPIFYQELSFSSFFVSFSFEGKDGHSHPGSRFMVSLSFSHICSKDS